MINVKCQNRISIFFKKKEAVKKASLKINYEKMYLSQKDIIVISFF